MRSALSRGSALAGNSTEYLTSLPVLAIGAAVMIGVLTTMSPAAAAGVTGLILLVALMTWGRPAHVIIDISSKRFRWVSIAWAVTLIPPIGRYSEGRSPLDAAQGSASIEHLLNFGIRGLIAAAALWSIRANGFKQQPLWLILALPALSLASAVWSEAPPITLALAFMSIQTYLLAVVTVGILQVDPEKGRQIINRGLRWMVIMVAALVLWGIVDPNPRVTSTGERFAWTGVHPLLAGAYIGFAMLTLLFSRRSEIGFSPTWRVLLMALFAVTLYLNVSRTILAGVAVASLFGLWFVLKGRGVVAVFAGLAATAVTMVLVLASFGGPITEYIYRGQSEQQITRLNGRIGLWEYAIEKLDTPRKWIFGHGLNSSRVVLLDVPWASNAHSAWVAILLDLGLLGVVVGLMLVVPLGLRLLSWNPDGPVINRALPILFVYCLAMSPTADGFGAPGPTPGLGFSIVVLGWVAVGMHQRLRSTAPARDYEPLPAPGLGPVPARALTALQGRPPASAGSAPT